MTRRYGETPKLFNDFIVSSLRSGEIRCEPKAVRTREGTMRDVLVAGAGKIGSTIADFLAATGDYRVTVADRDPARLDALGTGADVDRLVLDLADIAAVARALDGRHAVLSAAPHTVTASVCEAAVRAGAHYLDLTEDVAVTRRAKALAVDARSAVVPQCGLAPGFVSIAAFDLARRFETLDAVRMRVGALPQFPSNALNYNLTWSTDGLVNAYIQPCEAIVDGVLREVPALEGLEEFGLDGVAYEAFNTSGGLGTLCETLAGRVRTLNYRTIRYPGHCAIMRALLNDLRLRDRREVLIDILENALPATLQDVVVVFVTVSGQREGRLMQDTFAVRIYARPVGGTMRSAIQITTAAGICAMLDLLTEGALPDRGFVRQEDVSLDRFLANRFGAMYRAAEPVRAAA
jgi:saccharopine dehydrogenase-like NADP-dependent oxidoreductase